MEIGKLPNSLLNELVMKNINNKRKEIILRPNIGEDCTAFDIGNNLCVMSTDPITGATKNLGKLAVTISLNDIASAGAEPIGLMNTILIPSTSSKEDIKTVLDDISQTCDKYNVDILGGHTEVTDAVSKIVVITTAVGKVNKNKLIKSSGAKLGDCIFMTKYAGLEGTSIIINENEESLYNKLDIEEINEAKDLFDYISVVKEGRLLGELGVNSMHDVTEGGILGAIWEICSSSNLGANVYLDKIPIKKITTKICNIYNIDPLKLISSGSMLFTCSKDIKNTVMNTLKDNSIDFAYIGDIISEKINLINKEVSKELDEPGSDELYKVIK